MNVKYKNGKKYRIDVASIYYKCIVSKLDTDDMRTISAKPWLLSSKTYATEGDGYEDMRTILGIPFKSGNFKNGDDLSENLYKLLNNDPTKRHIRFGHVKLKKSKNSDMSEGHEYFEDERVIRDYEKQLNDTANFYASPRSYYYRGKGTRLTLEESKSCGLGNCRI